MSVATDTFEDVIAGLEPEIACEAHIIGVIDTKTNIRYNTDPHCPNPATGIIIVHTRKCLVTPTCMECWVFLQKIIGKIAARGGYLQCTCGDKFTYREGIWSEPL